MARHALGRGVFVLVIHVALGTRGRGMSARQYESGRCRVVKLSTLPLRAVMAGRTIVWKTRGCVIRALGLFVIGPVTGNARLFEGVIGFFSMTVAAFDIRMSSGQREASDSMIEFCP